MGKHYALPVVMQGLSLSIFLCLRVSVISRCSIEMAGRIEPVSGTEVSFDLSY